MRAKCFSSFPSRNRFVGKALFVETLRKSRCENSPPVDQLHLAARYEAISAETPSRRRFKSPRDDAPGVEKLASDQFSFRRSAAIFQCQRGSRPKGASMPPVNRRLFLSQRISARRFVAEPCRL